MNYIIKICQILLPTAKKESPKYLWNEREFIKNKVWNTLVVIERI